MDPIFKPKGRTFEILSRADEQSETLNFSGLVKGEGGGRVALSSSLRAGEVGVAIHTEPELFRGLPRRLFGHSRNDIMAFEIGNI